MPVVVLLLQSLFLYSQFLSKSVLLSFFSIASIAANLFYAFLNFGPLRIHFVFSDILLKYFLQHLLI